MRITQSKDDALGRVLFEILPGAHDGRPPVSNLWIDGRLTGRNADRICIAEAILFSGYIGGPVTFSTPCSARTANALRAFLAPRAASILSISVENEAQPVGAPAGGRTATIGSAATDDFKVALAPDARFRTIYDTDQAVFASNLTTLRRISQTDAAIALGLAVLFAQDLSIGRLVFERSDLAEFSDAALEGLGQALRGTDLAFETIGVSNQVR